MLDPGYVRDNLQAVRDGLRNRGMDPDKALEEIATLESVRRRLIPELEGLKRQQNASGDEIARAKRQGQDTGAHPGGRPSAQPADQAARNSARRDRISTDAGAADASQPAARHGADREERRRQRRGPQTRRAKNIRLRAEGALGPRSRARHHRLRARDEDCRGALYGPERRRRAALAGAHQLHARSPYARARLSRNRAAVSRQRGGVDRNRQPAEVRSRLVQDRRGLGPLPRSQRPRFR